MKIKDVIISESPAGTAYQHNTTAQQWRDYAALQKKPAQQNAQPAVDPNNYVKKDLAPKKQAPKKQAPKKQAPKKPVDAMAGADAGDQTSSGYTAQSQAQKSPEPAAPAQSGPDAPSAELDRLKQLAIGQPTLNQQASQQGAAMAQAASTTPPPQSGPLGIQAQSGAAFGQATPQADNPNPPPAQAAQPAVEPAVNTAAPANMGGYAQSATPASDGQAAQPEQPAPDPATIAPAVTSSSGQPIKTGTGGTLKSRSSDEIAWAQKFGPFGPPAGTYYPGAGNWDPRTGRTIKKETVQNSDLDLIKRLSGLR